MYHQMDCAIDDEHVTPDNSTGCLHDLQSAITTTDEDGGYHDSGFIQPVDFFGPGRILMIAVSNFSRGGHVSHVYNEHLSFVKFIERNWQLGTTLSDRSRDNLPNPLPGVNPYVPGNMPAIGDLFDLFHFGANEQD